MLPERFSFTTLFFLFFFTFNNYKQNKQMQFLQFELMQWLLEQLKRVMEPAKEKKWVKPARIMQPKRKKKQISRARVLTEEQEMFLNFFTDYCPRDDTKRYLERQKDYDLPFESARNEDEPTQETTHADNDNACNYSLLAGLFEAE